MDVLCSIIVASRMSAMSSHLVWPVNWHLRRIPSCGQRAQIASYTPMAEAITALSRSAVSIHPNLDFPVARPIT